LHLAQSSLVGGRKFAERERNEKIWNVETFVDATYCDLIVGDLPEYQNARNKKVSE
jgi:hypothetical protein